MSSGSVGLKEWWRALPSWEGTHPLPNIELSIAVDTRNRGNHPHSPKRGRRNLPVSTRRPELVPRIPSVPFSEDRRSVGHRGSVRGTRSPNDGPGRPRRRARGTSVVAGAGLIWTGLASSAKNRS